VLLKENFKSIMKRLLIVIPFFFLLSPFSYSQWWVNGGNLLWPYGDVTIKSNLNVDGAITNLQYQHILFHFIKNGDDQEVFFEIFRNDTHTTVDTVYWSGGSFGTQYFVEFSGDVINSSTQTLFYYSTYNSTWADTGYVQTQLHAYRSGYNNRILFLFKDDTGNPLDLFSADCYVDFIIVPKSIIDSYYYSW